MKTVYIVAIAAGGLLILYGVLATVFSRRRMSVRRCRRYRDPQRCLERRGRLCWVSGIGLVLLGLTFFSSPQPWEMMILLLWSAFTVLTWVGNELISLR